MNGNKHPRVKMHRKKQSSPGLHGIWENGTHRRTSLPETSGQLPRFPRESFWKASCCAIQHDSAASHDFQQRKFAIFFHMARLNQARSKLSGKAADTTAPRKHGPPPESEKISSPAQPAQRCCLISSRTSLLLLHQPISSVSMIICLNRLFQLCL